jgi:diguanylate cyclase (GGDEF)-like protein
MRLRCIVVLIAIAAFLNISTPVIAITDSSKNILIINSYHRGFEWTEGQVNGILSSIGSSYNTSIEYMDWKRYPSEENLNNFYRNIELKYSNEKIDLIICTDDAAFQFTLKNREELFSDAPVVFSGVNKAGIEEIGSGYSNYTGILENLDPENTILAAIALNPSLKNIYLLFDNSESGKSSAQLTQKASRNINPNLNIIPLNNFSSKEIIDEVKKADKNSIVLMTTYFSDVDNTSMDHQNFLHELTSVSAVPVFHLFDFGLGHGVIGGSILFAKDQGERAGLLAKEILSGTKIEDLPICDENTATLTFDYNNLKKYKVSRGDLPKNSTIINKPFAALLEMYRNLVYSVIAIFTLMILFTIILLFYIKKIKNMQRKMAENNEELTGLYEELTASEEELRSQFEEITANNEKLEEYSNELLYLSYHDTLTGLYNRLYLYERLQQELYKKPSSDDITAIFFVDSDNFKSVNDTMGHTFGDELLKAISCRLSGITDKNSSLIRIGGDEFVFFCTAFKDKGSIENFARKILQVFSSPFNIKDHILTITVSIGISLFPENATDLSTLLSYADMAMYKVKNTGKNGYFFFNNNLKDKIITKINIEKNLKKALSDDEFILYYQPQIRVESNTVVGFEALIRWNSSELGFLTPDKFIGIAEDTGFICVLGEWILRSACSFIYNLNKVRNADFKISVNISVIQLMQENFIQVVEQVLSDIGLSSVLLELEITETVIMDFPELAVDRIKTLRSMGINIALDDFGTGYSSLAYLRSIPITTLKIDKMFIDDITSTESSTTVTDTIIELGHKMDLSIVAEGVETLEQLEYLKKNGCDMLQGYLFSKPLTEKEIDKLLDL